MINCPICNFSTDLLTYKKDRFDNQYEYFICKKCRFLFEKDLVLDNRNLENKVSNVYQNDYFQKIDSGWKDRGDSFLKTLSLILNLYKFLSFTLRLRSGREKDVSILDYGGGNGYIASKISQNFNVLYYDKYEKPSISGRYKILEKPVRTDIIYAVELVEHITDIKEWDFLRELSPNAFIFTTGLSDNIGDKEVFNWPYLNPDAGHMALYSSKSLYLLAKKYGFVYFFYPSISCHIFLKNKLLSNVNFVSLEYFIYSLLRQIKLALKGLMKIF